MARSLPGGRLLDVVALSPDADTDEGTSKAAGYGDPLKIRVQDRNGAVKTLVFHTAHSDAFGHDRRADRAAEMLLSYDRFPLIPRHAPALDVGAIRKDGTGLISLADAGEFYLVTAYAEGHVYADELRRIAHTRTLTDLDRKHTDALAQHLVVVHSEKYRETSRYVRHVRDVVGSGEGVFGILDGYPEDVPAAPRRRLQAIEQRCVSWRHALRGREARLSRIHGDYHPFNLVFDDASELTLLDASRGCMGEPADDVTCLAVNYVFFAIEAPAAWRPAFRELWYRFWQSYLDLTRDQELLEVAAPFFAWRGLVVCNPVWYPAVGAAERERMLTLIEKVLDAPAFEPSLADEAFS